MNLQLIRMTARLSGTLFRYAPSVYATLYDRCKARSERGNIALIQRCVKPGHRVVDIGANIGFYTRHLAECVGPEGCVSAYEPDPLNHTRLVKRVRDYPQVRVYRAAVTDRSGTVQLHLSPDLNVDHRTYVTHEQRETIAVPAVTLDEIFQNELDVIHFIKMDIQGAEYEALLGMRDVVARSPDVRILMELSPYAYDHFGAGLEAILALLDVWGFEVRRVEGRHGRLGEQLTLCTPIPERTDPDGYFDVLCARPEYVRND